MLSVYANSDTDSETNFYTNANQYTDTKTNGNQYAKTDGYEYPDSDSGLYVFVLIEGNVREIRC